MVWARIDDAILDNPKIGRAGVLGFALHVAGITWACRNLSDGFIPDHRLRCLLDMSGVNIDMANPAAVPCGATSMAGNEGCDPFLVADHLVGVGLWDRVEGGYQVHDFLEYNPSKADVEAQRGAASERRKAAAAKRHASSSERNANVARTSRERNANVTRTSSAPDPDPDPVPIHPSDEQTPLPPKGDVGLVWEHYLAKRRELIPAGHDPELNDDRRRKLRDRLKRYGPERIMRAFDGQFASAWHRGEHPDNSTRYLDADRVIKTDATLEKFEGMPAVFVQPRSRASPRHAVQPTDTQADWFKRMTGTDSDG